MTFLHMLSLLAIGMLGGLLGAVIVLLIHNYNNKDRYFMQGMNCAFDAAWEWVERNYCVVDEVVKFPRFKSKLDMHKSYFRHVEVELEKRSENEN